MTVNKADAKFAVSAANGNMAEVVFGRLAQSHSSNSQVKDFGSMMIQDHSKANEKLQKLAKTKGISLPDTISNDQQRLALKFEKKNGASFDKAFRLGYRFVCLSS